MMREMMPDEIAEHDQRMAAQRAQMPPDVIQAIRTLRHWASMPDGWEEQAERAEAVRWFLLQSADFPPSPAATGGK